MNLKLKIQQTPAKAGTPINITRTKIQLSLTSKQVNNSIIKFVKFSFRIEKEKCVYYNKEDDYHPTFDHEDFICKECFMSDLRYQPFRRSAQLPHRLPGPKYANRKDCSLCKETTSHEEYICAGCLNLYREIDTNN